MLYVSLLYSLPSGCLAASIIAADVLSKLITAAMIDTLPTPGQKRRARQSTLQPSELHPFQPHHRRLRRHFVFIGASWGLIPALAVSIGLRFYFKRKLNGYR